MSTIDHRDKDVSDLFQKKRKKVIAIGIPYIIVIVAILLLQTLGIEMLFGVHLKVFVFIYLGAVIGFIWMARKNWRCPACDEILGRDHDPGYCRNCGAKLR
jgi:hypothetical protein